VETSSKSNMRGRGWRRAVARAARAIGSGAAVSAASLMIAGPALAGGPLLPLVYSIVPTNGDANPYGVVIPGPAFKGATVQPGDILVSNFNNADGLMGTGSTIVRIDANGNLTTFYTAAPANIGLDNALGLFKAGFEVVGNVPITYKDDGSVNTIGTGQLTFLDNKGNVVLNLTDPNIDGPWSAVVANDTGGTALLFVSNVLSGTVIRINLSLGKGTVKDTAINVIATGYTTTFTGPNVLTATAGGPAGLAYNATTDTLYVASSMDNAVGPNGAPGEIFAIAHASKVTGGTGTGTSIYKDTAHLDGPLGLTLATNGDLVTANFDPVAVDGEPSELTEFTPGGVFVSQLSIDGTAGGAFALYRTTVGKNNVGRFAWVDDVTSTVSVERIPLQ
jgi:hypothetical protein